MSTLRRIAPCLVLVLASLSWGARGEEPNCSNWTFDGVSSRTTEAQFLASFDTPPERYSLSSKNKPRYTHPDYRPEFGAELECFKTSMPATLHSASTYFDKNGLVRHFISYAWPMEWRSDLSVATREAEQRRRGKPVAGDGDEAVQKVQRCLADLGAKLEERLGPAEDEARSMKIPGTSTRVYHAKSWTDPDCEAQVFFGLFAGNTVSADDAECCGEPVIVLVPSTSR